MKYQWFNGKEWIDCYSINECLGSDLINVVTLPNSIEYYAKACELRKFKTKEKPKGFLIKILKKIHEHYNLKLDFKLYFGACNIRIFCFKNKGYTQMIHPCEFWSDINLLALEKTNAALENLGCRVFEESGITMISWGDDND